MILILKKLSDFLDTSFIQIISQNDITVKMKEISVKPYLLVAPTLMALTACGGSSDKSTALFAVDTGLPNAALASGTTFETQSGTVVAQKFSYRDDTAELVSEPVTIQLSRDADGTMHLAYGDQKFEFGEDAKFIEDDGRSYGFEKDIAVKDGSGEIEYIGLWSQEGEIDQVLAVDREDYAQVWGTWMSTQGAPREQTYFVVGAETKSEALGSFTSEDYQGFAYLVSRPVEGNPNKRTEARFENTVLTVNFSENKVTGVLGGAETRTRQYDAETDNWIRPDYATDTGTLLIKDGTISGNGFTADVVSGEAFTETDINTISGEMNGKFYGPAAEQVAGTLSGELSVGEDKSVAMGWFDAERPAE